MFRSRILTAGEVHKGEYEKEHHHRSRKLVHRPHKSVLSHQEHSGQPGWTRNWEASEPKRPSAPPGLEKRRSLLLEEETSLSTAGNSMCKVGDVRTDPPAA